jgi:hypothetical protein
VILAQASIRQLYEQVRVLEAEAARPARRRRLPHAVVLVAAATIGAASAGVSHPSAHREPSRAAAAAPVVHLIDEPAQRARALPAPAPHRARGVRRVAVQTATRTAHVTVPVPTHFARTASPHVSRVSVQHRTIAPVVVTHPVAPMHVTLPAQPRPHLTVVPVGVGPVVVATSEEPQADPSGVTPSAP